MARRGDALDLRGKTWYLDCRINGIRHQVRLGKGISRSVALELAQVQRGAILKGEAGIGKKRKDLSFDDARKKFEAWVKAEKRETTLRGYRQCLDRLAETFGGKRLSDLTPWAIEAYKRRRAEGVRLLDRPDGLSEAEWQRRCQQAAHGAPIRVNRELAVLKTLFNRCRDWGLYEGENPVCKVKFRKEPKVRLRWLEPEEEQRLLTEIPGASLRALVTVGTNCGLRIKAEALTLTWNSVDLKRGILTVEAAYAKNGRTRSIPLNSTVLEALKALHATTTCEHVFVNEKGLPYRSIGSIFKHACRRANLIGVTPHTLRHTFASRLVMAGVDLRTVQELGGWQTLSMVERYAHLSPAHKAHAVERIALTTSCQPEKPVLVAGR
jgi:integrase